MLLIVLRMIKLMFKFQESAYSRVVLEEKGAICEGNSVDL